MRKQDVDSQRQMKKEASMNLEKLKAKIDTKGIKQSHLANALCISKQAFSNKLLGKAEFKMSEANILYKELRLNTKEAIDIFFS